MRTLLRVLVLVLVLDKPLRTRYGKTSGELMAAAPCHASVIRVRVGVSRDGRLQALAAAERAATG